MELSSTGVVCTGLAQLYYPLWHTYNCWSEMPFNSIQLSDKHYLLSWNMSWITFFFFITSPRIPRDSPDEAPCSWQTGGSTMPSNRDTTEIPKLRKTPAGRRILMMILIAAFLRDEINRLKRVSYRVFTCLSALLITWTSATIAWISFTCSVFCSGSVTVRKCSS